MSARMRVTRAHTGNRRSHHALKEPRLSTCDKCNAQHLRHRMCPECGGYRGRTVVDVVAQKAKRFARREDRLKAMGDENAVNGKTEKEGSKEKPEKETKKEAKTKKPDTKATTKTKQKDDK